FGTGTTSIAAMILKRNSIGVDIDPSFISSFNQRIHHLEKSSSLYIDNRLKNHNEFVKTRDGNMKYFAENIGVPVMTSQEQNIIFYKIDSITQDSDNTFSTTYKKYEV